MQSLDAVFSRCGMEQFLIVFPRN